MGQGDTFECEDGTCGKSRCKLCNPPTRFYQGKSVCADCGVKLVRHMGKLVCPLCDLDGEYQ